MKELILHEDELIKQCKKNDRHAQEFFFNRFYKEQYIIGMRYLSDHHDTEDVVILTFTKVFKKLDSFTYSGPGSLGRWVRTIFINEAIRSLKKKKQIKFHEDMTYLNSGNQEENILHRLQADDIIRMIERLPSGYRTVFNLYCIEGYSHREIAALLGISENTSKTQLKKARGHLMNTINEENANGTF